LGLGAKRKTGVGMEVDTSTPRAEKLDSPATLTRHLDALLRLDPQLRPIADRAGPIDLRVAPAGFAGLARIVTGQQLSVASAEAIWGRIAALPGALTPEGYMALPEALTRAAGFSAGKHRTMRAVAGAMLEGRLDLDALALQPADAAIQAITRIRGLGPWTAELYLMFSAAHPDIFPAGDLALRRAIEWGLGLDASPSITEVGALARGWSPHRSTAALLFWRYYRAVRNREGLGV
jgi:DNA-3-methyladenine glycosylase II